MLAAPQTQQKPSVQAMAAPGGSHKRQAGLKPAEKAKLLVEYAQLPEKQGWLEGRPRGAVQELPSCWWCMPSCWWVCPSVYSACELCVCSVPGFSEALEMFYTVARDVH